MLSVTHELNYLLKSKESSERYEAFVRRLAHYLLCLVGGMDERRTNAS